VREDFLFIFGEMAGGLVLLLLLLLQILLRLFPLLLDTGALREDSRRGKR